MRIKENSPQNKFIVNKVEFCFTKMTMKTFYKNFL